MEGTYDDADDPDCDDLATIEPQENCFQKTKGVGNCEVSCDWRFQPKARRTSASRN